MTFRYVASAYPARRLHRPLPSHQSLTAAFRRAMAARDQTRAHVSSTGRPLHVTTTEYRASITSVDDGPTVFRHACRLGARRDRQQAEGFAVSLGAFA
jgi:hypothetical protein